MSKSLVLAFPAEVREELRALVARSEELARERRAQEERRQIAETRAAELLRQRDELGRQRVAIYEPGDKSRVDRLIAGDAEALDAKEAARRARHNEELGLRMRALETDADLLTGEVRRCAEQVARLDREIASVEESFLRALQAATFDGFRKAAAGLVLDYLAPLRAIDEVGGLTAGTPGALSPRSAQGICRLGWLEKRHTTVNGTHLEQEVPVTLWPHRGALPTGEPFDAARIVDAIRAELAGAEPGANVSVLKEEAA